jgi:hypothetical protein
MILWAAFFGLDSHPEWSSRNIPLFGFLCGSFSIGFPLNAPPEKKSVTRESWPKTDEVSEPKLLWAVVVFVFKEFGSRLSGTRKIPK